MKFYDRGNEIEIIRNNEESSKQSAKFTVLMGAVGVWEKEVAFNRGYVGCVV